MEEFKIVDGGINYIFTLLSDSVKIEKQDGTVFSNYFVPIKVFLEFVSVYNKREEVLTNILTKPISQPIYDDMSEAKQIFLPKELARKFIEFKTGQKGSYYTIQITNQSHRDTKFGENGRFNYVASNKIVLSSEICGPNWFKSVDGFCVWGPNKATDNKIVDISIKEDFDKIVAALREYNQKFASINIKVSNSEIGVKVKYIGYESNPKDLTIKIIAQTHIGKEFGINSEKYIASNNIILCSLSSVEWVRRENIFYVKGVNTNSDNSFAWIDSRDNYERVIAAIDEYNQKFSGVDINQKINEGKQRFFGARTTIRQKYVDYEIDTLGLTLKIIGQSHRGKEFGPKNNNFTASNGIVLTSGSYPSWDVNLRNFWVRGFDGDTDNTIVKIGNLEYLKIIVAALDEYNKEFSGEKEEPMERWQREDEMGQRKEIVFITQENVASNLYTIQIKEQTHIGKEFSENGDYEYRASNGILLASIGQPYWNKTLQRFSVRGTDKSRDNDAIKFEERVDFKRVCAALTEYNQKFGQVQEMPRINKYIRIVTTQKTIQITAQSHIGRKFGEDNNIYYKASNGIMLMSESYPNWTVKYSIFHVRGSDSTKDKTVVNVGNFNDAVAICSAINEYNAKFSDPNFKPEVQQKKQSSFDSSDGVLPATEDRYPI